MKIGIVGAGRVGCALAIGLEEKGFKISGIYSKSNSSVEFLSESLNENFENCLISTIRNSDLIFITVPDTLIEDTANTIVSQLSDADICGKTFMHCSGSLTSDMLHALRIKGAYTASFHPIQTFADRQIGWKSLENIYFGFEGDTEARNIAEQLVTGFNSSLLTINKQDKPIYHAAACILSNYTVTLSYIAGLLFEKIGIESDSGIKALAPLLEGTVKNITALGSLKALTGPISRGDSKVIEGHLKAFKDKSPEIIRIYQEIGALTNEIALKRGSINEETAAQLLKAMEVS